MKNHSCPVPHFERWVVVLDLPTWDLNSGLPLFQETLVIDDMWWSKLNKINDLCCCNEKDFFIFLWPGFHSSLMETWMNWMSVPHLQGQGDKYYAWLLLRHVGCSWKSNCFIPPSWLQDMCYFKLNLQGPKVIYLCQNGSRIEFWEKNNKFTVDVQNHNKFSVS